ncbi:MAG: hypothetical protein J6T00_00335 [Bacteroidaceae bacterium]|nr:hypothetical protein [Bacteroidaceae bacterium]
MTQQEVNRLIDLYMEGKTSPEEEHQLAIEVNRSDAPAEWKIIAEMLGELTLGEALYDQTMAERKRVRIRRYIGWSIAAVAACLTLWFVLGKLSIPTLQQDTAPQIAQQPKPVVKPEAKEKEVSTVLTPASPATEQVAYTAPKKHIRRKHRQPASPIAEMTEVVEVADSETIPELPQVSEEELAQVEKDYQMWQLKQAILMEKVELDAATMALNKKYEAYLEEYRNSIEI